jgi:cytochrome b involved in lipid metabolism
MARLVENPDSIYYTMEEVKMHNSEEDCWLVYEGRIYDVT